jgi:hypothetical protein
MALFSFNNGQHIELPPLEQDEKVLWHEEGVKVEQIGKPRTTVFPKSNVIVTTHKIIISQKKLFSKKHFPRIIIHHSKEIVSKVDFKKSLSSGTLVCASNHSDFSIVNDNEETYISIFLRGNTLVHGQKIEFRTQFPENFNLLLK